MTDPTRDPWLTERPWQIVRADLPLAHVFMPMSSFKFQPVPGGYKIVHENQGPHLDCFAGVTLHPAGHTQVAFEKAAAGKKLQPYDPNKPASYKEAADEIVKYMEMDRDVERLEGIIRVPCHAHGETNLPKDAVPGHPPFWVNTFIHVYQFSKAVSDDIPLLVFRAPLSPFCPTNNDGTAMGVPK